MSIRVKTLLIIGSTLTILIIGMYALSQLILLNSYIELEAQTVERNVQRAVNALSDQISVIHSTNVDWAHWNDTYEFVDDRNQEYLLANTYDGTFNLYGLNVMLFINAQNELVFGKAYDLGRHHEIPIPTSILTIAQDLQGPLSTLDDSGDLIPDGVAGLLLLPEGPMLVASTPILPTDLDGAPRGQLIWGSYLDEMKLAELAEQTRLTLRLRTLDTPAPSSSLPAIEASSGIVIQPLDTDFVVGSTTIHDIENRPALWLDTELPRSIYNQGQRSLTYYLISLSVLGVVFATATILLLEKVVLSRLAFLHERVVNYRSEKGVPSHIELAGSDELSSLATAMNTTLESLAQAQERLKLARDHALEASSAKAQILANVSHDSRTPLTVIMLRAEMLKRGMYGPLNEKQIPIIDSILANARQLLSFISNLLDGAQLESGKLHLHKRPFETASLLTPIRDAFLPLANQKGLSLSTDIEVEVPVQLYGDPDRLAQILFNLVGNAIKFTQQGTVAIRIYLYDSTHWAMEVKDTGIGISPEHQGRIFESFWQVDGTSTRMSTSGVGLGLAIVKQLTTLMGGFVEVKSEVNLGSTFTIVSPIEDKEGEPNARAEFSVDH